MDLLQTERLSLSYLHSGLPPVSMVELVLWGVRVRVLCLLILFILPLCLPASLSICIYTPLCLSVCLSVSVCLSLSFSVSLSVSSSVTRLSLGSVLVVGVVSCLSILSFYLVSASYTPPFSLPICMSCLFVLLPLYLHLFRLCLLSVCP